jgi:3-oxoacyl-[acyl-carrier-protein] synthase II
LTQHYDASAHPVRVAAEVLGFDAKDFVEKKDRKQLKLMVRTGELAVAGARLALADGGVAPGQLRPDRLGVAFGTGTVPGDLSDLGPPAQACRDPDRDRIDLARWGREGLPLMPPMWMLNHVPNMSACHISILYDARGPNNTITQSDAASLLALGEAARVLQRDHADVMLAGGADTRCDPTSAVRFSLFGHVSRCDDADRACRPFDRRRDGQVLGEGAAVLVLEGLDHARRRGARVRAELLGFASGFDRGGRGEGLARVVRQALAVAGLTPGELDHVNAHGLSTVREDAWEARGLREALGDVEVVAVKSYLGNIGSGAGAAELAASLAAFEGGVVPGTLNHDETGPDCPINVLREPRPLRRPFVLKVSLTERGQCACAVLRAGE